MNQRRELAQALGSLLALLVLAACGSAQPSPTVPPPIASATTIQPTPPPAAATPGPGSLSTATRHALFDHVWRLVRDRYVYADYGGLDWESVRQEYSTKVAGVASDDEFYDLMREMIGQLDDDRSAFYSASEMAEMEAFYQGLEIPGGIGVRLWQIEDAIVIVRVLPGGPAAKAGLERGDRIAAVDKVPITELGGIEGIVRAITGEAETEVVLSVQSRAGDEGEFAVTRARIDLGDLAVQGSAIEGTDLGLLILDAFDFYQVPDVVEEALGELMDGGTMEGLVIDLRSSAGGDRDVLLRTLGLFLEPGSIGQNVGREDAHELLVPSGRLLAELEGVPIAVLISPDTEAEAELFAAAMQLKERATIIGAPSAGNTEHSVAHVLSDGSLLSLSESIYHLPDGSLIEGVGVQPDVVVEADWWLYDVLDDPQVQAAIEQLGSK